LIPGISTILKITKYAHGSDWALRAVGPGHGITPSQRCLERQIR
jgi:hypothetical protein